MWHDSLRDTRAYSHTFASGCRAVVMIGLFDSGSGGLTVLAALRARVPHADIVYFGDIKNVPYGERSAEELSRLTEHGLIRLRDTGATENVGACKGVSLSAHAGAPGHNNVIEIARPTARALRAHTR